MMMDVIFDAKLLRVFGNREIDRDYVQLTGSLQQWTSASEVQDLVSFMIRRPSLIRPRVYILRNMVSI
jgi:hypothetical protein